MKKILYMLLCGAMITGFIACESGAPTNEHGNNQNNNPAEEEVNNNPTEDEVSEAEELIDVGHNYFMGENGVYYKTTSSSTAEVVCDITLEEPEYGKGYKNIWPDIIIPDRVSIKGKEYMVTSIMKTAFRACYELSSVTIGSNVKSIGSGAFWNCPNLTKVTSYIKSPKDVAYYDTFYYTDVDYLFVPKGTKHIYQNLEPWNEAKQIIEMNE